MNCSIRLDEADADQWDDLGSALGKATGRRTLTKADTMGALVRLANDQKARKMLADILIGNATKRRELLRVYPGTVRHIVSAPSPIIHPLDQSC